MQDSVFSNAKPRVYLLGVLGSGMAPLARFAARTGRFATVAGVDAGAARHPEKRAPLEADGVQVFADHDPARIDGKFDCVVYSSAIPIDHPERARAAELAGRGVRLLHRMEFLNVCFEGCERALAVAGTHGKTSTASLLGWALLELGLDPHILVGGRPLYLKEGVRVGGGQIGAYETDESDGSFLKSEASLRLILNVDHDHLEHYGSFAALVAAFERFARDGRAAALNLDDPELRALHERLGADSQSSGAVPENASPIGFTTEVAHFAAAEYRGRFLSDAASPGEAGAAPASDALEVFRAPPARDGNAGEVAERLGLLQLPLPGRHFASNALGVFALLDGARRRRELPDFDPRRLLDALNRFPGVERRLERIGTQNGAVYYDDYGHHPTEIRAVLRALRGRLAPDARIIAVFQPHRFTRTAALFREFAAELSAADAVVLFPIYSAGEDASLYPGVSAELIAEALEQCGARVLRAENNDFATAAELTRPGDAVVCLGAGDISQGLRAYFAGLADGATKP